MSSPDSRPSTSGTKRRVENGDEVEAKSPKISIESTSGDDREYTVNFKLIQNAFKGDTSTYRIIVDTNDGDISDLQAIFSLAQEEILREIKEKYKKLGYLKVVLNLQGCFDDNQYDEFDLSDSVIIYEDKFIESQIKSALDAIIAQFQTFDQEEDGDKIFSHLDIHIHRHIKSNNMYVDLPGHIIRHVVSVHSKNESEQSFKWALLAGFHPEIYSPSDYTLEEYSDELILTDIEHPVKLSDIPKIEEMNDISINVFVMRYNFKPNKREEIEGPVYHTARRRNKHFNLLLLQNGRDHYCYIKDLRGLVDSNGRGKICDGCLSFFDIDTSLNNHQERECLRKKIVLTSPNKEKTMKFIPDDKIEKMPVVVYADFEAFLEPIEESTGKKGRTQKETYTKNINRHVPYNFAYFIKCADDALSQLRTYNGLDCGEKLMSMLRDDLQDICRQIKDVSVVPVFFHNFSNYDGNFISRVLDAVPGKVSGIGSKYNFISIHKTLAVKDSTGSNVNIQLRFLDSYNFLKGPLETLATNLDTEKFFEAHRYWREHEKFELMIQKGSFPYEFVKSLEDLERSFLPPIEQFYSSVKNSHITEEDYDRALKVWNLLECETIRDYSEHYAISDVLILADLFENLRNVCLETYNLDPAKYFAISGLSWDAMLQITDVELELLTDVKMLTFLDNAKRSGIAHCTKRHAIANNEYLPDVYDEKKENTFIMFYDANNLYGWAMSQPLPYGGFEWVKNCSVEWIEDNILSNFPVVSEVGYFLEVDLKYPSGLHDWHADLPFCPERKEIPNCKGKKLVTDLTSKKRYILHHSYLIQCIHGGLILENVYRVLKFNQRPWLKPYIDFNTERRRAATTVIDKDFYKLMNNNIFGKSIQSDEKYCNLEFVDHWFNIGRKQGGHTKTWKADYHSHAVMSNDLVVVQLNKMKREFKMPIYIGISVYDLSKSHMYDFHYNFMKKHYGENLKLLYTDTDSFIYEIKTNDYYSEMKDKIEDRFDTSDYPDDNMLQSQQNKKKVGFFKDELKGEVIKEFIALRPKVYIVEAETKTILKAAGVPKAFQTFTIDDFKKCLYNQEKIYREMFRIKSVGYDIYTQKYKKVVLSPNYINRHILDNLIDTLPFGHKNLVKDDMSDL